MRLALTLLAKNEAEVVDANLAFHLAAGVDFVVATDNGSTDGTVEILEGYAERGVLELIHEPSTDFRQGEWVTCMARRAAERGAHWVINADADEFWWPRAGDLKEAFARLPKRYGVVHGLWRPFVPLVDDGGYFAERMTLRLSMQAAINDPTNPFRPARKASHRAHREIRVRDGNHDVEGTPLVTLHGWYPFEVFHLPLRTREQVERKYTAGGGGGRAPRAPLRPRRSAARVSCRSTVRRRRGAAARSRRRSARRGHALAQRSESARRRRPPAFPAVIRERAIAVRAAVSRGRRPLRGRGRGRRPGRRGPNPA